MIVLWYKKIREFISYLGLDELMGLMPSNAKNIKIYDHFMRPSSFYSVTKALQCNETTIADARVLSDAVL